MGPRNRFQEINSASPCSLAGRYDNPSSLVPSPHRLFKNSSSGAPHSLSPQLQMPSSRIGCLLVQQYSFVCDACCLKCRRSTKFPQLEMTMARSWAAPACACDTDQCHALDTAYTYHALRVQLTLKCILLYHEMTTSNGQIQVLCLILHCSQQSALLKSCQLLPVRGIGQKRATCGQFPPEHTLTSLPSGSSAC